MPDASHFPCAVAPMIAYGLNNDVPFAERPDQLVTERTIMRNAFLMSVLFVTACTKPTNPHPADRSAAEKTQFTAPTVNAAKDAYARSVDCFIYAGLNNMNEQSDGKFVGNEMIPILINDATTKGAAVGKDSATVKAELLAAVKNGAADAASMRQEEKETYVLKSTGEALTCLKAIRARAKS